MKISLDLLQVFFTSSMDIVSITHELSKDYIENLRNSSYLKIGFIMVEMVVSGDHRNFYFNQQEMVLGE